MNNNIQEIHHICGISVIPNSVKIQKSDISYQLSDIEKKAVISRVKYLQRTHINKKLYFYIDNPLMGIYEKLAEVYPNEYANLINCYEIIKEKIIDNIGYETSCKILNRIIVLLKKIK